MISTNSNAEVLENDLLSDFDLESYLDDYLDSYLISGSSSSGPMADSEDILRGSEYAESVIAFNPVQMAAEGSTDYVNVIRMDCIIDGDPCTLLLPPEYIDKIFIDDQNRLWNMSASTIQGRIVDDQFNPYQTEGKQSNTPACLLSDTD